MSHPQILSIFFCLIVTIGLDDFIVLGSSWGDDFASLECQLLQFPLLHIGHQCLCLPLGLQILNHIQILPSHFMSQTAQAAVLAIRSQAEDPHGNRHAYSLLLAVGWWDALEHLKTLQSLLSTLGLVWNHSCNKMKITQSSSPRFFRIHCTFNCGSDF